MGKMEINPDKLYEASSRLSKLGAAIQQQITTLNEVGKGVEKGWKSSNSILFMEQIDVTKKNMDKLGSVTIDLAGKLQKIAQAAEETEKQMLHYSVMEPVLPEVVPAVVEVHHGRV